MLGDMPRRKILAYADDDVSVQYTLRGGGFGDSWIDLFVYPASRDVEEEAREVETQLVKNLTATQIPSPSPPPPSAADGRDGWFRGTIKGRSMTSFYLIVRRGSWYILVRGSSPDEAGEAGITRMITAVREIDWAWNAAVDKDVVEGRKEPIRARADKVDVAA